MYTLAPIAYPAWYLAWVAVPLCRLKLRYMPILVPVYSLEWYLPPGYYYPYYYP